MRSGQRRAHPLDAAAQIWMRATSRQIDPGAAPWLVGPAAGTDVVGHAWVEHEARNLGGHTSSGETHGLLPSFDVLAGPLFDPSAVAAGVRDLYEHTSRRRIDLWSEWSPAAWPFGRAISALWSRRLQQLSLPTRPLDVSWGMDSTVVHLHDGSGVVVAAAWQRSMRKTRETTYSGLYGTTTLPGSDQPRVRVVFPLPRGWLPVFLSPTVGRDASLHPRSPLGAFGAAGAYRVLVDDAASLFVRRIPILEHFHVYVDDEGDLRCDHDLRLRGVPAIALRYRMT